MTARASMTVARPGRRRREAAHAAAAGRSRAPWSSSAPAISLHRKLMPALYHLMLDGLLPDEFAVIAVGPRATLDDDILPRRRCETRSGPSRRDARRLRPKAWERFCGAAPLRLRRAGRTRRRTTRIRKRLAEIDARLPGGQRAPVLSRHSAQPVRGDHQPARRVGHRAADARSRSSVPGCASSSRSRSAGAWRAPAR